MVWYIVITIISNLSLGPHVYLKFVRDPLILLFPSPLRGSAPQGALHVTVRKDSKGNYANEVSFIFF